jgi:cytochrome c-type biogenesis protein
VTIGAGGFTASGVLLAGTQQTIADGSLLLAVPLAMVAGLVSFASPCVLPLVPGYLGYVTGLTGVDLEKQSRARMVSGMVLFVLGFTAVYVAMGAAVGALGAVFLAHRDAISRVLGVVTIGLGLIYLGAMPALQTERRLDVRPAAGLAGAPLLGAVFAIGWSACMGPTLGAILALTGIGGNPARGALLATAYCLGLGIPFVVAGLAYRRAMGAFAVIRRHRVAVTRVGGAMLIAIGVLIATGLWTQLTTAVSGTIAGFEVGI